MIDLNLQLKLSVALLSTWRSARCLLTNSLKQSETRSGLASISLPTLAVLEQNAILAAGIYPPPAMQLGMICTVDATKKSEPAPRQHRDWGNEILEIQQEKCRSCSLIATIHDVWLAKLVVAVGLLESSTTGSTHSETGTCEYLLHGLENSYINDLYKRHLIICTLRLYDSRISCHHTGWLSQRCTIAGFA